MVQRQWKATVAIGGTIASSLPSSAKKASAELERLSSAQRIDRRESQRLSSELRTLRRGTDAWKTALAQQSSVKDRLAERSVRIRSLGERTQASTGVLGRFGGVLGRVGPYGAAAAAGIGLATAAAVGLVKILDNFAGQTRQVSLQSTIFGVSTEQLQRDSAALRTVTGDAEQARQQVAGLAKVGQTVRLAAIGQGAGDFGAISLGASRAGVSLESLKSGRYDRVVDDIRRSLARGISTDQITGGLREVGLTEEQIGSLKTLAADVDAYARAKENAASVQLITAEDIRLGREWDDAIGDLKQTVGETSRGFSSQFAPSVTSATRSLLNWQSVTQASGTAVAEMVNSAARQIERLSLTGEYLASTWEVSSAGIRVGWHRVDATVTGVTDSVLAKLEKLVAGFVSVAESVKEATGVDFTKPGAAALASIRELRADTQDANAAAEAGLTRARADLRAANSRLVLQSHLNRECLKASLVMGLQGSGLMPASPP